MRLLTALLVLVPAPALAHLSHLGEVAGHGHWVAGAAIGAAVVVGVWGWLKGREEAQNSDAEAEDSEPEAGDA
jgi:hypothetical protein